MSYPSQLKARKYFDEKYGHLKGDDLTKELLYTQKVQIEKLELLRSNTSKLVWCLVAILVVSTVIVLLMVAVKGV